MANERPLTEDTKLIVESDGETCSVALDEGFDPDADPPKEIAWQAPGSTDEEFMWLVRSAAAFHDIPVEDRT